MRSLFRELKDRQVIKVGAVYVIAGWLILQVADLVLENIGAPAWVMQVLMLFLALGLPIVLIIAWAFELTSEGVKKADSGEKSNERVFYVAISFILISIAAWYVYGEFSTDEQKIDGVVMQDAATLADSEDAAEESSIAVLPFESFSTDASDEYFADGLADTLLHKLAQIPSLRVIARNSSFQFKGSNKDIREIGELLSVAYVLEGSVQRQNDQIRIIAQLIDTSDGAHIWSETYDDTLENVFDVQDRIAQAIVGQLSISMNDIEFQRLASHGTKNPEAYEQLLRAAAIRRDRDLDASNVTAETDEVIRLLERAIEADPDYAHAWSSLSDRYSALAFFETNTVQYDTYAALAKEAAETAIELNPEYDDAYANLGFAYWRLSDANNAAIQFRKALELNANNSGAMSGLGLATMRIDPHEAYRLFLGAAMRNPESRSVQRQLSFALQGMGRMDEAFETLSRAAERFPEFNLYYEDLSDLSMETLGRYDLAAEWLSTLLKESPTSHTALADMTGIWYDIGDFERGDAWLAVLQRTHADSDNVPGHTARQHLRRNDANSAIEVIKIASGGDINSRRYVNMTLAACHLQNDIECFDAAVSSLEALIAQLEGAGYGESSRRQVVLALAKSLRADPDSEQETNLRSMLSEIKGWPITYQGGRGVKQSGYLPALLHARLGEPALAIAALNTVFRIDDGGVMTDDEIGMPIERSIFLESLHDEEGYRQWLDDFTARREAMRQKMIQMESAGDIANPNSL